VCVHVGRGVFAIQLVVRTRRKYKAAGAPKSICVARENGVRWWCALLRLANMSTSDVRCGWGSTAGVGRGVWGGVCLTIITNMATSDVCGSWGSTGGVCG